MKKKIFYTIALCLIILLSLFSILQTAKVRAGINANNSYGGRIIAVTYCPCWYDPGVVLTIQDLSMGGAPLKIFYSPITSLLRANYNIFKPGPNVLGGYIPVPRPCQVTTFIVCSIADYAAGTIDTIRGIGSSAI